MRDILFIIYLSLSPILAGSVSAASDLDSLERIVASLPAASKLEKLDELASDKGTGLDYSITRIGCLRKPSGRRMIPIRGMPCSRSSVITIQGISIACISSCGKPSLSF